MTPLPILLAAFFHGTGNCSSKVVHGSAGFSSIAASMIMKFKRNDGVQQESSCYFGHCTEMNLMSLSY